MQFTVACERIHFASTSFRPTDPTGRNHPFIILMKTRYLRARVPSTFLQQSYQTARVYADWVCRLICEMEEANLMLYEPFAGYLVSIAASIHLERTLSEKRDAAASTTYKFEKCIGFVGKLAEMWPNMKNLVMPCKRLRGPVLADLNR